MKQCTIHSNSLRFSRAVYGIMVLLAFFIHNEWLVLVTAVLMILGVLSIKFNIPYQFHTLILNRKSMPVQKELAELNFVAGMTAALLLIGFFLIYFNRLVDFAWIYLLVVDFLIFLACFVGFCVATLMYVFFKKIFIKK